MVSVGQGKVEGWVDGWEFGKITGKARPGEGGMCVVFLKPIQYDNTGSYLENWHRNPVI